jgi:large subunit ribosomal protein L25
MATEQLTLNVSRRQEQGKHAARRLRRAGQVPCILYGRHTEAMALVADSQELAAVADHPHILKLKVKGSKTYNVLLKDLQRDYLANILLHADFVAVNMKEKLHAMVPLEPHGEPIGSHHGAQLQQLVREIDVECLPQDLPERITVEVSALDVHDSISLGDLVMPEGVTPLFADPEVMAFTMLSARIAEEAEAPAEGELPVGEGVEAAAAETDAEAE